MPLWSPIGRRCLLSTCALAACVERASQPLDATAGVTDATHLETLNDAATRDDVTDVEDLGEPDDPGDATRDVDAPPCPPGASLCDGRCIASGACCGLPETGVARAVALAYDGRVVMQSPRVTLSQDIGVEPESTSALMAYGGRLWFAHASPDCRGVRTVSFAPSQDGSVSDVVARCETVSGAVTAVSITRDASGLLGCFSNPSRTADRVQCGRWSGGPGTWTPRGSTWPVASARWFDSESTPFAAWSFATAGATQLDIVRFDAEMNLARRIAVARTTDTVTSSAVAGDTTWLLRHPVDPAAPPSIVRIRGDELLTDIDLSAVGQPRDWQGSLAASDAGVALAIQNDRGVVLLRLDESGARGRRAIEENLFGRGALVPFEDGWLFVGSNYNYPWMLRMDCAGRLREAPVPLTRFGGSSLRFEGLAASPDGVGFWVLIAAHRNGLERSVQRLRW